MTRRAATILTITLLFILSGVRPAAAGPDPSRGPRASMVRVQKHYLAPLALLVPLVLNACSPALYLAPDVDTLPTVSTGPATHVQQVPGTFFTRHSKGHRWLEVRPATMGGERGVVVNYGTIEDRQSKPADFARFRVAAAALGGKASEAKDWHPSGSYRTTRDIAAFFSEAGLRRIQAATVADLAGALGSAPTKKQAAELHRLKRRLLANHVSAPAAIFELNPHGPDLGDNWACGYEDRLALAGLLAGDEVTLLRASLSHPFKGPRVEFSSDAPIADPGYAQRFCSEGYTVANEMRKLTRSH